MARNAGWLIRKLDRIHIVDDFDCGHDALNRFISRFALHSQSAGSTRTYVALADEKVVGYYSLAVGAVAHAQAPTRMVKGLARHPVPVMLLARLAVDNGAKRKGLGAALLHDALARTLQAADIAGIRAVIVHAKDNDARRFYEHFDFDPSPTDPYHLHLLIKDLRKATKGT
ncbi:GNAT family N-acetyltransferase [Sulfuritalea sp.]|uniref:GNAT family N-acetyltransferase n=1 Tax=Sulfuritalea sp. TaxID=2480090 RepID=UPI00286D8363|nr:GNAT family N-acetyltransferase [Sulfuritalea sp.]